MKSFPAYWPALVAQSRVVWAAAYVVTGTTAPVRLKIVDGRATLNRDDADEFTATAVDPTRRLTSSGTRALTQPFIHEVVVKCGVYHPSILAPLSFQVGVFGITRREIDETNGQVRLTISGKDRSERVAEPLPSTYSVGAGMPWVEVMRDIIRLQYPDSMFTNNWPPRDPTIPVPGKLYAPEVLIEAEADAWAKCKEFALNISRELDLTGDGRFDLIRIPDSSVGNPVWRYVDGRNAGVIDVHASLDSESIYQGTRCRGLNGIVGEFWNDNPASLTSRPRTGRQRVHTFDANVGSQLEADGRAMTQLTIDNLTAEQVTFSAHANAALDKRDLIFFRRDEDGVVGNHIVNRIELPLGTTEDMTCTIGKH